MSIKERHKLFYDFGKRFVGQSYSIGICDCNLIALSAIDLILNTNYFERLFGKYDNIKDGLRFSKKETGFYRISDILVYNKAYEISVTYAQAGDIFITKDVGAFDSCSLCLGDGVFVSAVEGGAASIKTVDLLEVQKLNKTRAYRLPH